MPIQNITSKFDLDASDLDKLDAKFDGLIKKQKELEKQTAEVGQEFTKAAKPVQEWGAKAETAGKKVSDSLKQTGNQTGILGNSFKSLGGIMAGVFAADRIISYGKEIVELGVKFQTLRTSIEFSSGSIEAGALNMQYLSDVSKRLGLDLLGATKGFQQILASGKAAGLEADTVRDIFEGVATASRVMGKSAADQEGIFLALSQMLSKGTVQAEELRGQIGERLPGAFELAAKSIGVTTQELNKMLEQGQVLSADFVPKFAATLKAEFENGIPKAVQSTGYALTQLGNNYDKLLNNLSESNEGFINRTIKNTSKLLDWLGEAFKDQDKKVYQERLAANGAFENDISKQFKNIAKAAKESGKDVPQALGEAAKYYTDNIRKQIEITQKEYDKLNKTGFHTMNAEQDAMGINSQYDFDKVLVEKKNKLVELRGELGAVSNAVNASLKAISAGTGKAITPLGTIEELEKAIKILQQSKKDTVGLTQAQANQYNQTIKFYQDLLDKLNGVEKKGSKKKGPKLPDIATPTFDLPKEAEEPWDILFKHYDDLEKKGTDTPQKMAEYWAHLWGGVMPEEMAKFTDAELAAMEEDQKRWEAIQDAKLEYRKAVEEEAVNFAISSANAYMDFRAQQLSDELGMISAMREADLVLAGDNEQAKADINAEFANKEAEIKRKQAVNDRNQALFNIAVNTAQGIMSVLSTGGGTRYADFGISAGILTALVAATGAVQAGLVLARPLPQFFKGTDSSPEGFAWVGERGAEGKITPDGKFSMIPGGAHIDYLQKGTKIIPNHQLSNFVGTEISTPNVSISDTHNAGIDIKRLGMEIGRNITLQQQTFDERGFRVYTVKQNQRKERLERKNRFNR